MKSKGIKPLKLVVCFICLLPFAINAQEKAIEKQSDPNQKERAELENFFAKKSQVSLLDRRIESLREYEDFGPAKASIYAERLGSVGILANGGSDWGVTGVDASIVGFSNWGNQFSAGVAAYSYIDYANSAALIASRPNGANAAKLSFKDANNKDWAGHFTGDVHIDGEVQLEELAGTGTRNLVVDADGNVEVGSETKEYNMCIGPASFTSTNPDEYIFNFLLGSTHSTNESGSIFIPIELPTGAVITELKVHYYDNDATNDLRFIFRRNSIASSLPGLVYSNTTSSGQDPNYRTINFTGGLPAIIFENNIYQVYVSNNTGQKWHSTLTRVKGVYVKYEL